MQRHYRPGERYVYRTLRTYRENGEQTRVEQAESVHTIVAGRPPRERISFRRMIRDENGERHDLSEQIAAFPPYEVSLAQDAGEAALELPNLSGWDMRVVGVVTDVHTFLVAISPQAGVDRLHHPGDRFRLPAPVRGTWSNGAEVVVGEDCIDVTSILNQREPAVAVVETRFEPPEQACLEALAPGMEARVVAAHPNNFQQKLRMGEVFIAMWGLERFTVLSRIDPRNGALLSATMDNALTLRMRVGCDPSLQNCATEVPLTLHRAVEIELIEGGPADSR